MAMSALPPRRFPSTGFVKLDLGEEIEEENLPLYVAENYYPVQIGDVFRSRYQAVSKLGYGTSSTVWLCRDLREGGFYSLKICVRGQRPRHEIAVSDHLKNSHDHVGKGFVRLVLDSFEIDGPHGKHTCLVYQPLGMSYTEFQDLLPDKRLPTELIQRSIQFSLISLSFMHQNDVIHTDISSNNLLYGIEDSSVLDKIEDDEMKRPIARKILADRVIYYSRPMPVCTGLPVIVDFGEARVGKSKQKGDIMPGIYRSPEVILDMEWDCKVDIWSIGTMVWDMLEGSHLFYAKKNRILDDEQHIAEMVSLMGPPPPEFLSRSEKCNRFWDAQGNWQGAVPIPEQSFEMRELQLTGKEKELFLQFLRKVFRWLPEERPTAEELVFDDFLMQYRLGVNST